MGKSIKDIVKQANKARQKGGLLLAGSGRAGPMNDKRHPTAKQARLSHRSYFDHFPKQVTAIVASHPIMV